jgi:hypothetical protein
LNPAFRATFVVPANVSITRAGLVDQKDGVRGGFKGCGDLRGMQQ